MPSVAELKKEIGASVDAMLADLMATNQQDIIPEAKRIANSMLLYAQAALEDDEAARVIWASLERQLASLRAICIRRSYEATMDLMMRIGTAAVAVLFRAAGV